METDVIKTSFSGALIAIVNEGKKAKLPSMGDFEHIEMAIEDGEKTLILVSKRDSRKHYRPSNKALFSNEWIVID